MNRNVVLDTNIVLNFVNKTQGFLDISEQFIGDKRSISIINKLELLGFAKITPAEENRINNFLATVTVLPITNAIETETIKIRRKTRLKLPDAIIAATAIATGAQIVTGDKRFLKCKYPTLAFWQSV
jgi:predicted nucleic acid-binding protein